MVAIMGTTFKYIANIGFRSRFLWVCHVHSDWNVVKTAAPSRACSEPSNQNHSGLCRAFSSGSSSSRRIVAAAETEIVVAAAETV